MNRSGKSAWVGTFVGCGVLLCLALACGSTTTENVGTVKADVIVCNVSPAGAPTEYYVLPAMNHKLRSYPEFAAEIGMTAVSDCSGGRAFFRAYSQYSDRHPGFDAHEGHDPLAPPPPMSSAAPPTLTVPKIANGMAASLGGFMQQSQTGQTTNEPVVLLTWADKSTCTGTFIAKNWIATGAHCLLPVTRCGTGALTGVPFEFKGDCNGDGGGPNVFAAVHLYAYQNVTIQWTDSFGNPATDPRATLHSNFADVLQIPQPQYLGHDDNYNDSRHDFALLYLNKDLYDPLLPPNADDGSAMRIATSSPGNSPLFFEGTGNAMGVKFQFGQVPLPVTFLANENGSPGTDVIMGQPSAFARGCSGDSGGPLYRLSPFGTPQNSGMTPILVGTTVGNIAGNPDAATTICSSASNGDKDIWKNVAAPTVFDFITESMRLWNNSDKFGCAITPDPGTVGQSIAQCWGTPCDVTTPPNPNPTNLHGCGPGLICSRPGSDVRSSLPKDSDGCPICGALPNDCSCIVGQCIPGPTTNDQSEAGAD